LLLTHASHPVCFCIVPELRSQQIVIRVTPTEAQMLKALADAGGEYQADVIRRMIRREYAKASKAAKRAKGAQ
jgi:hypothetical protein